MRLFELYSKINETPEKLNFVVNAIQNNPDVLNRVYKMLRTDPDQEDSIKPEDYLDPEQTAPETDYLNPVVKKAFIEALVKTQGDITELEEFLKTYGQANYIDTKKIMQGKTSWDEWIIGSGQVSKEFAMDLFTNLFEFTPSVMNSPRGPGEAGLCLLSPTITFATKGDIRVEGVEVEVKGEKSTGGGRLKNGRDDFGNPDLEGFFNKNEVPQEMAIMSVTGNAKPQKTHFLDVAKNLENFKPGLGKEYVNLQINGNYIYADQDLKDKLINNWHTLNYVSCYDILKRIAFTNYGNVLRKKGFDIIMLINKPYKNCLTFKLDDLEQHMDDFKLGSIDFADQINGPAVQASMKR
jgi:hypothetical protein